jgi:Flp pilus assembly protein TadD
MRTTVRRLAAAATVAGLCAAARAEPPPRPRPDPDAMREARAAPTAGRHASARAISHYLAARRRLAAGDLAGRAEELRLAVAHDPESAELRACHAEALAMAGRIDEAEAEARQAVALDPGGRHAAAGLVLLGRIHAARRQPGPALRELAAAAAIEAARAAAGEPADPEAWRVAAEVHLEAGDADAALGQAEEAAARAGRDGGAAREVGRALLERRDLDRAERALRQAARVRPDDAEAWRLLAGLHEARRGIPEAREAWLSLLRLDPDDEDAAVAMGRLALLEGDEAAAAAWFERVLRAAEEGGEARLRVAFEWLEARRPSEALREALAGLAGAPDEPGLLLVAGLARQALGRWEESAATLARVGPEAGESWLSARAALAHALTRAGRPAEALAALEAPLLARPGDERLLAARARALLRAGRGDEAVAGLRAAIGERARRGEPSPGLHPALAEALAWTGRAEEAVTALEAAVAARPGDGGLLYALGAAWERAGRFDRAEAQMRALLLLEPDHAEALNFIGYLLADRGERLDEAEALVRRALDLSPRSGHLVDSLGWVSFRKGDLAQAVRLLEEADRLSGPDPAILDHLGDAYRASGRAADAQAAWRRGLASLGDEAPAEQLALRAALTRKLGELEAAGAVGTAAR